MKVFDTRLAGVKRIEIPVFSDERGYFLESYQARRYEKLLGLTASFVQDNSSRSRRGVLRGLHYQNTHPQGKLVQVAHGEIFDVVVDLRPDSPDFGRWEGLTLSGYGQAASQADQADQPGPATHTQLWIPPGFAHGFVVLSGSAMVHYKCTDYYHPEDQVCLRWNDPDLAIAWPIDAPILSEQDRRGRGLAELFGGVP